MTQIHPEAHAALMTDRPEMLALLRARLAQEGRLTEDAGLLLNALEQALEASWEARRRAAEVDKVLKDQVRVLKGAAGQSEALRDVLEHGGTYQNAVDRNQDDGADTTLRA